MLSITQNGLKKVLKPKPACMTTEEWEEIDKKTLATIQFCLTNEVLREIIHCITTTDLWLNLEQLYMIN